MSLTIAINPAYAERAVNFSGLASLFCIQHERTGAHPKRFFCAHSSMVDCGGATSVAPVLVPGKANPKQSATLLISLNGGRPHNKHEVFIMVKSFFAVRDDVAPDQLADHVRYLSFQSHALNDAIGDLIQCKSELQDQDVFSRLGWLHWLLTNTLEQQGMLCERLERVALVVPTEERT